MIIELVVRQVMMIKKVLMVCNDNSASTKANNSCYDNGDRTSNSDNDEIIGMKMIIATVRIKINYKNYMKNVNKTQS